MVKLKAIQDTLSRLGKTILLVYAPCKAWYYPEYIPGTHGNPETSYNNYKVSKRIGDSIGIFQIDFNSWFLAMKNTTHELLFSKLGIHWTNYGAILGADSLARYIDHVRHIHMPYAIWDKVEHTTQARAPDNDLADIANLIFPMANDTFCYPVLKYAEDTTTTKPMAIFMGDSFVINLLRTEVIQNMYTDWQFWFYSRCVLNNNDWEKAEYIQIKDYDWKSELKKADCIIILNTAMNCKNISDGLIEKIYDYYYPGK